MNFVKVKTTAGQDLYVNLDRVDFIQADDQIPKWMIRISGDDHFIWDPTSIQALRAKLS